VLIVGAGNSGKILAEKLLFENFYGINIIGFIDNKIKKDEFVFGNIQSLGNLNELDKIYKTNNIDEVIISVDNVDYENLLKIIDYCNSLNLNVKLSSELLSIIPEKIVTETYSGMPLLDLSEKVNKDINIIFKRAFDLVVTIFTVILISPFMLVIALLIKLSSKGKVFYKQERIGKDGRKFNFYKFRSMVDSDNLDEEHKNKVREFILIGAKKGEELTKIIDEKRITSIGKFLRRTSLDELPQFFNVLKGDMSLVGPRPCLPYEYEVFDDWHKRRHSVLPGCTGVWQVTGRGSVSFKDSIILDLYYVNNITPWLDLQLIFKTIPVMVTGRGAK
ncbi:MAG: sugar transferase, partial [Flavobacteriales bacterium]|nr:sugar transferase [Flavobacteriales bacterium]